MSTPASPVSDKSKLDPAEVQELVAFALFFNYEQTLSPAEVKVEGCISTWQQDLPRRAKNRKLAAALMVSLHEVGIELKVSSKVDASAGLKTLITIPERVAYDLGSER